MEAGWGEGKKSHALPVSFCTELYLWFGRGTMNKGGYAEKAEESFAFKAYSIGAGALKEELV